MQEAISEAAAALTPLRAELSDAVGGATSKADALTRIAAVRKRHANSTELADALFVPMVMGELAGQLMVYEHEAPGVKIAPLRASSPQQKFALGDAQPVEAFLNLPWDEALAYFRNRGIMSERELSTLLKNTTARTKAARKDLLEQIQQRVHGLLDQAIENGTDFRDFAKQIAADADGLGITNQDPAYLQTVFRTNVLGAYGAGRAAAMADPAVKAARPWRQIRTAGDARVGEDHAPLDGLVFEAEGPLADLKSPFRFGCRCVIVTLAEWTGPVITQMPAGAVAPGFG